MKKIIFLFFVMISLDVRGAQKCATVDQTGNTPCSSNYEQYYYKTQWHAVCPATTGNPVSGIGVCAKTTGTWDQNEVTVRDSLEISGTTSENVNCWCRLVSPAVSQWVYWGKHNQSQQCEIACAYGCAHSSQYSQYASKPYLLYRQGLFSNLKD